MKRWAVRYTSNDGRVNWVSQGSGSSEKVEMAYLYTKKGLAENKARYFREHKQWYKDVEVVQFNVMIDEGAENEMV
jgi:hypothetical protein